MWQFSSNNGNKKAFLLKAINHIFTSMMLNLIFAYDGIYMRKKNQLQTL